MCVIQREYDNGKVAHGFYELTIRSWNIQGSMDNIDNEETITHYCC